VEGVAETIIGTIHWFNAVTETIDKNGGILDNLAFYIRAFCCNVELSRE
jgi:hypothetical protein